MRISRPLVDNWCVDSQALCSLLGVKQLTVIDLLKDIVFPDIEGKPIVCGFQFKFVFSLSTLEI